MRLPFFTFTVVFESLGTVVTVTLQVSFLPVVNVAVTVEVPLFIWSSSDTKVARVTSYGDVVAAGVGSCVITATSRSNSNVTFIYSSYFSFINSSNLLIRTSPRLYCSTNKLNSFAYTYSYRSWWNIYLCYCNC